MLLCQQNTEQEKSSSRGIFTLMVVGCFAIFCKHRVDWKQRDTVVDHVKSRKHTTEKLTAKGEPERKKIAHAFF